MAEPLILALTTEADADRAEALAQALLERQLAACVALTPQHSLYRWGGSWQRSQEVQLLIKTHPCRLEELERVVHQLHSYATPEWITWQADGSPGYGRWLAHQCTGLARA
jgi:periplasmic divalent cation tolerance protein